MSRARPTWLIAAFSAAGALTVGAQPTGWFAADLAWVGVLGLAVPLLAAHARRGPAMWASVVVLLASAGTIGPGVFAVAATALALMAQVDGRDRFRLAAVGAFAVQAALRLPDPSAIPLLSAAFGTAAITPLVVSGARGLRGRTRLIVHRTAFLAAPLTIALCLAYAVSALQARGHLVSAIDAADRATTAIAAAETSEASTAMQEAEKEMRAVTRRLAPRWARPLGAVPIVGPNIRTTELLAVETSRLLDDAASVVQDVTDAESATMSASIDVDSLTALSTSLDSLGATLQRTHRALPDSHSPWLAPPLARAAGRAHDESARLEPLVEKASRVTNALPRALGASSPAHYFVIMATPAETRFFGGFMGAWAVLRVDDGDVEIVRSGSNSEFDDPTGARGRSLVGEPEFLARYGARYSPARFPKNVTASPDFPTVARVVRELAPQLGIDEPLTGVIYLDPHAIEAFVTLIDRPIAIPGFEHTIDGTTTADFLLREQYLLFGGDQSTERKNMLQEVLAATVLAMFEKGMPSPQNLRRTLAPAAEAGHLSLHVFDPEIQALVDEVGWSGAFPDRKGGDLFSLRTANANANKIDTYLERAIHYDVVLGERSIEAVASVTLTSTAPGADLPMSLIGNINGDPPGDNRMYFSFYSPWRLRDARLDGAALIMEEARELGLWVHSAAVVVPAGQQRTVELTLDGARVANAPYRLAVAEQVLARRDEVSITVSERNQLTHADVFPARRGTVTRLLVAPKSAG